MKIALDANRYSDFMRGDPVAVNVIRRSEWLFIPFIVLTEIRAGFRGGLRQEQNDMNLADFLQRRRVGLLFPDETTTHFYAEIVVALHRRGRPIPTNDIWIAALVIQHQLTLFTRNRHFEAIPRVPRI